MSAKNFDTIIDQIGALSVIELASLVKALEEKFGVSAAAPQVVAAAGAGAAAAPQAEEKSQYKVTLKESGEEKIKVIRALRAAIPTLGLTEAKKAVDDAPTVIAESASKEDAKKIKELLEAAGAKVELA